MKLKPTEIKRNITDYVQAVETHYTGIIEGQKIKMDKVKKDCKSKIGQVAKRLDERSELQDILIDALEKTKLQIFKRKLKQEKLLNKKNRDLSARVNEISKSVMVNNVDPKLSSPATTSADNSSY